MTCSRGFDTAATADASRPAALLVQVHPTATIFTGHEDEKQCLRLDEVSFLEQQLPGFRRSGGGRDDGKEAGELCAIFYDAQRLTLLGEGTFWLSPTPDVPSTGWNNALPRTASWVQLREPA